MKIVRAGRAGIIFFLFWYAYFGRKVPNVCQMFTYSCLRVSIARFFDRVGVYSWTECQQLRGSGENLSLVKEETMGAWSKLDKKRR